MDKKILYSIGLTKTECDIYSTLVEYGPNYVTQLAHKTGITRQHLYGVLEKLSKMKLIEKTSGKRLRYAAKHPGRILEIAKAQKNEKTENVALIEKAMPQVLSAYRLSTKRPDVAVLEGYEGVKALYDTIIRDRETVSLFRSPYDIKSKKIDALIDRHRRERVIHRIHAKALTPVGSHAMYNFFNNDKKRLVERRFVDPKIFHLNSEINIWGKKVAITSLKNKTVVTIIDNEDIAQTLKMLFVYIWESSAQYHNDVVKKYKDKYCGKAKTDGS